MSDDRVDLAVAESQAQTARQRLAGTLVELQARLNPKALAREAVQELKETGAGICARGAGRGQAPSADRGRRRGRDRAVPGAAADSRILLGKRPDETAAPPHEFDQQPGPRPCERKVRMTEVSTPPAPESNPVRGTDGKELRLGPRKPRARRWKRRREAARETARRTAEGIEANPLSVLVGGVALGVLAGALIPRTEQEGKLLGPVGKRLTDTAIGRGSGRAGRGQGRTRFARPQSQCRARSGRQGDRRRAEGAHDCRERGSQGIQDQGISIGRWVHLGEFRL